MTLAEYIAYLENDINLLKQQEDKVVLDCCDNRELEILTEVLETLQNLKG